VFDEKFISELAQALAPGVAALLQPHLVAKIAPRYLSLDQAAEYLSTTTDGVRGMMRAKMFPGRKMGARLFIDIRDIDKSMAENLIWL
jgi:hypothetical protein